ncbi:MAG: sensor histidine kinase [Oscillospiraceae bacterium]
MKQLQNKLWAKITALLLIIVLAVVALAGAAGVAVLAAEDAYIDGGESMRRDILGSMVYSRLDDIVWPYEASLQEGETSAYLDDAYSRENSNFLYTIRDTGGNVLRSNDTGEPSRYARSDTFLLTVYDGEAEVSETFRFEGYDEREAYILAQASDGSHLQDYRAYEVADDTAPSGVWYVLEVNTRADGYMEVEVTGALAEDLSAMDDFRTASFWLDKLISLRNVLIAIVVISLLACLALLIFLLCAAGHKEGVEGIYLCWLHRIPFDLLAAVLIIAGVTVAALGIEIARANTAVIAVVAMVLCGALCLLLLMALLMSFSARAKAGKWWRNTVLWRLWHALYRLCRWTVRAVLYPLRNLSGCWQIVALVVGVILLELLVSLLADSMYAFIPIWWLERIPLLLLLAYLALSFRRIEEGGRELANGNLSYQVSTEFMPPPFRRHAEHLNHIGVGMQRAVEQQMKSERMKTELITNVSHDIKTPLTSIVNYVALLKALDLKDETAREYIEVLDRQSARLRKLTEDLVEASKASTGNLTVTPERTDMNLLLAQVAGEYEDRLQEQKLELVTRLSPEEPAVLADGKLLWRVFDNLMSNICKYSLPGTRVYLTSEVKDGRVTASFKNISRYELNISSDELMERFVRGDSSRSTEGSGLGLSIARSLTSLQGGAFDISIDGDLFRADVSFDRCE